MQNTIIIFDALTGEIIERKLTKEEQAELELANQDFQAELVAEQVKAEARTSALAKLAALGLTEDEIASL